MRPAFESSTASSIPEGITKNFAKKRWIKVVTGPGRGASSLAAFMLLSVPLGASRLMSRTINDRVNQDLPERRGERGAAKSITRAKMVLPT